MVIHCTIIIVGKIGCWYVGSGSIAVEIGKFLQLCICKESRDRRLTKPVAMGVEGGGQSRECDIINKIR